MNANPLRAVVYWAAVAVSVFNALTAVGGGIAVLVTGGLGMPSEFLEGGPFTSFVIPGVVLLLVVGGSQTVAAVLLVARRESALVWTAVAGAGMLIWIFVETSMIRASSWLQVTYFVTGGVQIIAVIALLGVVAWLPRAPLRTAPTDSRQFGQPAGVPGASTSASASRSGARP